ncbi:MAG: barstar family protein [Clostridia bacterium]|nr:barstar family protein [Clostridia bacterium]
MRTIDVDCRNVKSPKAFQILLQYALDFPEWYGRNLDALHDLLTEPIDRHVRLHIGNPEGEMAAYLERVIQVFADSAEENRHFTWETI